MSRPRGHGTRLTSLHGHLSFTVTTQLAKQNHAASPKSTDGADSYKPIRKICVPPNTHLHSICEYAPGKRGLGSVTSPLTRRTVTTESAIEPFQVQPPAKARPAPGRACSACSSPSEVAPSRCGSSPPLKDHSVRTSDIGCSADTRIAREPGVYGWTISARLGPVRRLAGAPNVGFKETAVCRDPPQRANPAGSHRPHGQGSPHRSGTGHARPYGWCGTPPSRCRRS